jgi:methylmalonyl-CoA mutase C-terminal domain/subunit
MSAKRPIKVLIAKAGLDGHERGALVVASGLREAGLEVVYSGIRKTPEQIVALAIREDVDAIGLSSLSGAHMAQFRRVLEVLKQQKVKGMLVFAGGIIPDEDVNKLQKLGVKAVFGPGSPVASIAAFLRKSLKQRTTGAVSRAQPAHREHARQQLADRRAEQQSDESVAQRGVTPASRHQRVECGPPRDLPGPPPRRARVGGF